MGLNETKGIITKDKFTRNPFNASNLQLAAQNKSSLPTSMKDVRIDRNQNVYYSIEHVLKRLVQNDAYINQFLKKSENQVSVAVKNGLISAFNNDVDMSPYETGLSSKYISDHIAEYHTPDGGNCMLSTVQDLYADADMSNTNELSIRNNFLKYPTGTTSIQQLNGMLSNDIVMEYEFNDSPNVLKASNYVIVSVCNKKTKGTFTQSFVDQANVAIDVPGLKTCPYIYKRWLSGFKELYIYIPTTYTFYNDNDSPDWTGPHDNATWIRVKINSRHFKLNNVYQAHICGQSLPLWIHREGTSGCYNDVVLPSVLRTFCASPDPDTDNNTNVIYDKYNAQYVFYFMCYGTDAQAIRIFGD